MRIITIIGGGGPNAEVWTDVFLHELGSRGQLTVHETSAALSPEEGAALVRDHEVAIVGWDSHGLSPLLAADPGHLRYVCCYSGTIRFFVPRELVEAGLWVSNWGDLPSSRVAEAAMMHLLAAVHDLGAARQAQQQGRWGFDPRWIGKVEGLAVGIYGLGVIGRRFVELLAPFGAHIRVFDPYVADVPDGCEQVQSLAELCDQAEALVIHAGLSDETTGSVTAEHLARLPDGGIVINTARGAIVDQTALFAELESGRLRAGLDVLEPEELDTNHPIRSLPNVHLTFHEAPQYRWPPRPGLTPIQQRVLDQLDRYAAGETPRFLFDLDRFDHST